MLRALLVSSSVLALFLLAASPAVAQAPPGPLPPPGFSPPPAVTYYSGPGVMYFATPRFAFYGATPLPATVYPSGYGYTVGPVATVYSWGLFHPRGVRTYYRPGYLVGPMPPPPAPPHVP